MRSCNSTVAFLRASRRGILVTTLLSFASASALAQGASYVDGVQITRDATKSVFKTSTRRALYSAVRAISNEYGWTIDYEETAIAPADVEDIAPAQWKAAHPSDVGVLVPRSEEILLAIPNDHVLREGKDKPVVMQSLVAASLESRTDRVRTVQVEPDGRATVIDAQPAELIPIGSYKISVQAGTVEGMVGVANIVANCSSASGHRLVIGSAPVNLLAQIRFRSSGGPTTCRSALNQILDAAPYRLAYSIMFDPGSGQFVLNIEYVRSTIISPSGELKSSPISNLLP